MLKRGTLIIVCIFCIAIIIFGEKNIKTIKNTIGLYNQTLIYSEYIDYMAWESKMIVENPDYDNLKILIDISEKRLYLIKDNRALKTYPIASGKDSTPSPIGTWQIISKAKWGGGFGTRWMGLNVPWGTYY